MKSVINLLMLFTLSSLHADGVHLRFQADIDSKAQKLGEIIQIDKDTKHWSDLALQSSPVAGERISKKQILAWMTQKVGLFNYTWEGARTIKVKQVIQTPGALLIEKARTELLNHLQSRYQRVELKTLSTAKDSEYALNEFQTEIKSGYPPSKRTCIWLKHEKKHIPIWFEVHAFARVLVAKKNIKINTLIQNDMLLWQEQDVAGLPDQPVEHYPQNAWLNSSLLKNKILLTSQLKEVPQIIKGQELKVSFNKKAIHVIMDAIALNDGYKGQSISIKNPVNQEVFVARVTGSGHAEVYL